MNEDYEKKFDEIITYNKIRQKGERAAKFTLIFLILYIVAAFIGLGYLIYWIVSL